MAREYKLVRRLGGLQTDQLPDKISAAKASVVENIDLSSNGVIQTVGGSLQFADVNSTQGAITRLFLFRKNFGTLLNVKMAVFDNGTTSEIKWHNDVDDTWATLVDSLASGTLFDFEAANGNDNNKENLVVWGDGTGNFSTWSGATASVASSTTTTIVCNETLQPDNGFSTTGTVVASDGTEYAYTGITAKTFTGVTPDASGLSVDEGIAQKADVTTHSGNEKGDILVIHQAKLFLSGVETNESKIHYSVTNNVTDFTITTGVASGGTVDVMDLGGKITNLESKGKNTIIVYKEDGVLAP